MASRGAIESQINEVYNAELGGNADAGGLDFYADRVESGELTIQDVIAQINASPEGQAYDRSGQASASRETIDYAGEPSAFDLQYNPSDYGTGDYSAASQRYQRENYPAEYQYFTPVAPGTVLEANPLYQTLTPREGFDYDVQFGAKSLDAGGTAPTPEAINKAFETFFNRPADIPGIEGYMASGKSMEQISADLAYQALYAPELTLAPNAEYYEAPSIAQQRYIEALGGGTPTYQQEDTFSYSAFMPLSPGEIRGLYENFGYEPTDQDIQYWTQIYAMSPDVRYSPNPRQQMIDAILAGSNLPQYQYLKQGVEKIADAPLQWSGSRPTPGSISGKEYVDYGASQTPGTPAPFTPAPFGGYFSEGFNPFDYTGIAPTPLTYTGYDPTSVQYQSDLANLAQFNPPTAPVETPAGEDQGIAAVVPGTT